MVDGSGDSAWSERVDDTPEVEEPVFVEDSLFVSSSGSVSPEVDP